MSHATSTTGFPDSNTYSTACRFNSGGDMVAEKAALLDPDASPEFWSVVGTGLVGALCELLADHITRPDPLPEDVVLEGIFHIFDAFGAAYVLTMRPDDRRSVASPARRTRKKSAASR